MSNTKNQLFFIINPNSGMGRHKAVIQAIEKNLSASEYVIELTRYAGHGSLLAQKAAAMGYKAIIACGGDGSVNEIGSVLIGSNTPFGIIPVGSGNGLARHLGIPLKLDAALATLKKFNLQTVDTARINDQPFLGMAGIGFDAFIGKKFANYGKRGFASYVKLIFREYKGFKQKKVTLFIDDKKIQKRVLMLSFANSGQYGNNAIIAPEASLQSGKIGLCLVKKFPIWKTPFIAFQMFTGKINQSKYVETIWVEKATIKQKKKIAHLDGEPMKLGKTLTVEVVPKSLTVIC